MITEGAKQKIRDAIKADPHRWRTSGGNENGPRTTEIDGQEISIGWDPLDRTWAAWDNQGNEIQI